MCHGCQKTQTRRWLPDRSMKCAVKFLLPTKCAVKIMLTRCAVVNTGQQLRMLCIYPFINLQYFFGMYVVTSRVHIRNTSLQHTYSVLFHCTLLAVYRTLGVTMEDMTILCTTHQVFNITPRCYSLELYMDFLYKSCLLYYVKYNELCMICVFYDASYCCNRRQHHRLHFLKSLNFYRTPGQF